MFTIFLRRLQKYSLVFKVLIFLGSLGSLGYLIINTEPNTGEIVLAAFLLSISLFCLFSIILSLNLSILLALIFSFLLFLKAVNLLTTLNLGIFAIFLVLLSFYLFQRPKNLESKAERRKMSRGLFPRGWVSGIGRKKLQ